VLVEEGLPLFLHSTPVVRFLVFTQPDKESLQPGLIRNVFAVPGSARLGFFKCISHLSKEPTMFLPKCLCLADVVRAFGCGHYLSAYSISVNVIRNRLSSANSIRRSKWWLR
jgi:hypothetical protein